MPHLSSIKEFLQEGNRHLNAALYSKTATLPGLARVLLNSLLQVPAGSSPWINQQVPGTRTLQTGNPEPALYRERCTISQLQQKPKQPTKPQPPGLCWALPFGQLSGHSPEAEHSVLSLFKSTSSSDHNGNQSQVTTQRRIHGNLKTKDTEMMLQWLQQEKVSLFLLHPCHPTIFPFHSHQVCTLSANSIYHTNGENTKG